MTTQGKQSRRQRLTVRRRLARVTVLAVAMIAGSQVATGFEEFRTIDGTGNSNWHVEMGAAGTPLLRLTAHAYEDAIAEPNGSDRPNPREISNAVSAETEVLLNEAAASDYIWLWGQFLDHDITLSPEAEPAEPLDIVVPRGDPWFDPGRTGAVRLLFNRSIYDPQTGTRRNNPRRQLNVITSWIDASNVYGSDRRRAEALRRNDGSGRMKTSRGKLLPLNRDGLPNAGGTSRHLFVAGDIRANEQLSLTAVHALWVREHNRIARQLRNRYPGMDGEEIYQRARAEIGALMQVISYREFLPLLLGEDAIPEYEGWNPYVDASITSEFSTAAFRFGHSMVSERLLRLKRNLRPIPRGHLELRDAFFTPMKLRDTGIEPVLRGVAHQFARRIDTMIVDSLRNFLFGPPGAGGLDLVSLNIQRGRDHGLESLNGTRRSFGLRPYYYFDEITSDRKLAARLEELYGDVEKIDLWVGGLAEEHVDGALVGETFWHIIRDQFIRLRDGDRFWYQRAFRGAELRRLESTRLSDVIRRNTRIRREIPDDVFRVPRWSKAS